MKKQELMEMPHLAISEEKPEMFVHIEAEEGYKITDYFDDYDIKNYFSTSQMYLPIKEVITSDCAKTGADVSFSKVTSTNGFYESDERLKDFTDDIKTDFDKIKSIPKKYYYWKDKEKRGEELQVGTSAQELRKVYPELVNEDKDGYLSVDYARLSVIALKAIDDLNEKNNKLEKENQLLKKENDEIKERLRKIEEKLGL